MRSFIKKLAGTMAFTMAVSAVAPAGVVFADEEAFIAMQGGDTMVADITLATGRTVDFRFVGAPADWSELDPTWTSSIPAVAEVNAAGIVTAKKAGVTTITIALSNGWMATAKVTVKDIPNDTTAPVYLAFQNTLEAVTDAHVLLNTKDGVDFWFINAPDGWQDMNPTWASSNTAVATVDGAGIVKGVTDGFTTLTFSLNGKVVASTEITVGNPVVEEPEEPVVEDELVVEGIATCYEVLDEEGNVVDYDYLDEATEITEGDTLNVGVYYVAKLMNGEDMIEDYTDVYYGFDWVSSNEEVVTVEDGVLTAVGAGEATLTATGVVVEGYEAEEVSTTITVVEAAVDTSYEAKQKSEKVIELTFADAEYAATLTKDMIKLERAIDADRKDPCLIKEFKVDGNKVTISPYASFADGDTYVITVNGEEEGTTIVTKIGAVASVDVTYKSVDENGNTIKGQDEAGKAYISEDDETIYVQLAVKLYDANGVDVTNVYSTEDSLTYELVEENETVYFEDEYAGKLVFNKAGEAVVVKATYVYYDADGNEIPVFREVPVIAEEAPAYEVIGVKAWTVAKDGDKIDWTKVNHETRALEDKDAVIVALVEDNYGNTYVTDDRFVDADKKIYAMDVDSKFKKEGYEVRFSSVDVAKVVIDEDGTITAPKKTTAGFNISLHNENSKAKDNYVKTLAQATLTVGEKRALASVTASDDLTLATKGSYTTGTVKFALKDQDGNAWGKTDSVKIEVTTNGAKFTTVEVNKDADGVFKYTFDGKTLGTDNEDGTLKFKVTAGDKSDTFKITLKTPDEKANSTFDVVASDVNQKIADGVEDSVVANTVNYFELKSGIKYGLTKIDIATAGTFKLEEGQVAKGTKYLAVYKPDGSLLDVSKDDSIGVRVNDDNSYSVVVATTKQVAPSIATDSAITVMDYADAGNYKVEIIEVNGFNSKSKVARFTSKDKDTFKVENSNAYNTTTLKATSQKLLEMPSNTSIKDVIIGAIGFSKDVKADNVFDYTVYQSGDYLMIENVTFKFAVNNKQTDVYYLVKVPVDMTVKFVD